MKYIHEDGTPFTKEEFLQKLKTDKEFNNEFGNKGIDQISELIRLLKETPDSRRMVVSAWAVHDLPKMVLPPCHYGFQVYTRELSLVERREIAKNKLKQMEWADVIKLAHYKETYDKYNIPTRTREPFPLPTLNINTEFWPYEGGECGEGPLDAVAIFNSFADDNFCKCLLEEDIQLSNYQSHSTIKAPLSN